MQPPTLFVCLYKYLLCPARTEEGDCRLPKGPAVCRGHVVFDRELFRASPRIHARQPELHGASMTERLKAKFPP